jgi:hypothetical protein
MSCGSSNEYNDGKDSIDTPNKALETSPTINSSNPDTTNQYVYDFIKVVIADQNLDLSYGLSIEPEQNCDLSQDDRIFLETLLIGDSKTAKDTSSGLYFSINMNEFPKCLKRKDIKEMLVQKEKLSNFKWDNSRLGFNPSNKQNWYCFSRPLFSVDKKIVIMMIRSLCPGLCGTGWTVVFTNKNNKWNSQMGGQWMH